MKIKTLVINVMTALALALMMEFIVGYGLRNPTLIPDFLQKSYSHFYETEDRSILQVTDCAEWDADLFYRFKTGHCTFANREFTVSNEFNSAGLRDDEASLNNPSVVVFGDSFTQGWGVAQENCYPSILEQLSRQKVLNAGVSSFGTAREMKLLKKLDFSHINTVIIQYHPNDHEENLTSIEHGFVLPISPKHTYDSLKQNIFDRAQYFPFKYLKGISKALAWSVIADKKPVNDTLEAKAFLEILLHAGIHRVAARTLVFRIDNAKNENGFVDAVDHLLEDTRFSGMNISTVRIDGLIDKKDYYVLDTHFRASGHQKLAAKLNEYLDKTIIPVRNDNLPVVVVNNPE